jgi:hypothetical protein
MDWADEVDSGPGVAVSLGGFTGPVDHAFVLEPRKEIGGLGNYK